MKPLTASSLAVATGVALETSVSGLSGTSEAWDAAAFWNLAYPAAVLACGTLGYAAAEHSPRRTPRSSMPSEPATTPRRSGRVRRWIRRGFLLWALVSTTWLANSMRTQGISEALLRSEQGVTVRDREEALAFVPVAPHDRAGLVFLCGSGVAAQAYAALLRPVAEAGHPVFVVKLPYRFAPFESHRREALARARRVLAGHPEIARWVVAGHSLGGALAARLALAEPQRLAALVLIGTTHPKRDDLSSLTIPVTKIYATEDGVAPVERVMANKALLPPQTTWVAIEGGNHSQFGHYGHQLLDGTATISREAQQASTRSTLLQTLDAAAR